MTIVKTKTGTRTYYNGHWYWGHDLVEILLIDLLRQGKSIYVPRYSNITL